jgi:hypothetical protein
MTVLAEIEKCMDGKFGVKSQLTSYVCYVYVTLIKMAEPLPVPGID